jgi:hypothetical protein
MNNETMSESAKRSQLPLWHPTSSPTRGSERTRDDPDRSKEAWGRRPMRKTKPPKMIENALKCAILRGTARDAKRSQRGPPGDAPRTRGG